MTATTYPSELHGLVEESATLYRKARVLSRFFAAIERGEIPSIPDIQSVEEIERVCSLLPHSIDSVVFVGYMVAQQMPDAALDRLMDLMPISAFFVLWEAGTSLAADHWQLAEQRLGHVLRRHDRVVDSYIGRADLWRGFVRNHRAPEVVSIFAKYGRDAQFRPLLEALRAAATGEDASLAHLAPEVRKPAEEILAQLNAPDESVVPTRKARRAWRSSRSSPRSGRRVSAAWRARSRPGRRT
jgi:hypothetical protein